MSEKIKAIRGNEKRCEDVVTWLEEHGAKDAKHQVEGSCDDRMYFVDPNGNVECANKKFKYLFDVEELPRWRAKFDEEYWYIDDAIKVRCTTEELSRIDEDRYVGLNYFQTEGEAEEYCRRIEKILEERQSF